MVISFGRIQLIWLTINGKSVRITGIMLIKNPGHQDNRSIIDLRALS